MDLSVTICSYNNAESLRQTLDSLARQHLPEGIAWQLVCVDNNSTDGTGEVAARFVDRIPIEVVRESRQGIAHARNTALTRCDGRLVVFTDDDVEFEPGWIAAYAAHIDDAGRFFGGPVISVFEGDPPPPELLAWAPGSVRGFELGDPERALTEREEFLGANWAAPTAAIREAGGFDTSLGLDPSLGRVRTGEESDLMRRLRASGLVGWYLPDAAVRHHVPPAKCSRSHIAARIESGLRYRASRGMSRLRGRSIGPFRKSPGVEVLMAWSRYAQARLRGRRGDDEYLRYRCARGTAQGMRELRTRGMPGND